MSRFNTPKAIAKMAREAALAPAPDAGAPSVPVALNAESRPPSTRRAILPTASADVSVFQQVGFGLLCIFPMSAFANEFAMRAFHFKAYISTASWVLLPLLLVLSGNMLRG